MNEIKNQIKKIVNSKIFAYAIYVLGGLFISVLIFKAGVAVGFHKALFVRNWDTNYSRNFGYVHKRGFMMKGDFENLPNAHGAVGRIINVELPTIIVEDTDKTEKVILISDSTRIRRMRDDLRKEDLKVDGFVIVIGSPNDSGQIDAKLIRLMPAPPKEMTHIER